MDPRIERMASALVRYSLALQPGDVFLIKGSDLSAPLIRAVYKEALKAGAHPEVIPSLAGLAEIFYEEANDDQIAFVSPLSRLSVEEYDAYLAIKGDHNTRSLSEVDPKKQAARAKANADINRRFMERTAAGALRWCLTEFPTHARAQEANMSLAAYERFVFQACRVDQDDPVAVWQTVHDEQERLIRHMNRFRTLRIVGEGTDLALDVGGRTWINGDGKANFPDGEIFTGPVEDSANGTIRFSFPGIYGGKPIEDIRLWFEKGKVVKAEAAQGKDLLEALLRTDPGASYLGEIGIGTNFGIDRFTRNMLFDEKIGGTVHLALGSGYPESGSKNQSAIHWDMLCDLRQGGQIYGDGELIYEEGRFLF